MKLLDGRNIETYPIKGAEGTEGLNKLALDDTGTYLRLGRNKPMKAPQGVSEEEKAEAELFTKNAYFLLLHANDILADSRMFLAPIRGITSGIMYTGTSGFRHPTLGVYIEWWLNCEESVIEQENGEVKLVYKLMGSPLSGMNHCGVVAQDGTTGIQSLPSFLPLWSKFMNINTAYDEYKFTCEAYTLEEVLAILRNGEKDVPLLEATQRSMRWRTIAKETKIKLKKAKDKIREMERTIRLLHIRIHAADLLPHYIAYLKRKQECEARLEELHTQHIEQRRRLKAGEITNNEHSLMVKAYYKEKGDLEYIVHGGEFEKMLRELIPDEPQLTIADANDFFNSRPDLLTPTPTPE